MVGRVIPPTLVSTDLAGASPSPPPLPHLVGFTLIRSLCRRSCLPFLLGSTLDRAGHLRAVGSTPQPGPCKVTVAWASC